jgi:hypothetical protein
MKNKYRSKLEADIAKHLDTSGVKYDFEPTWGKLSYTVPAKDCKYLPDFYVRTKSGKLIIVEGKGIWVYEDRFKHYLIRKAKPDLDIRFVFSNSKSKIRKGSSTTYADICEGRGRGLFRGMTWQYADRKVPLEWLEE